MGGGVNYTLTYFFDFLKVSWTHFYLSLLNEVLFKKLTEGLFEDITEINLLGNNNNTLPLKYLGTIEKLK